MTKEEMDRWYDLLKERDDLMASIASQSYVANKLKMSYVEEVTIQVHGFACGTCEALSADLLRSVENYLRLQEARLQEIENKIASKFKE